MSFDIVTSPIHHFDIVLHHYSTHESTVYVTNYIPVQYEYILYIQYILYCIGEMSAVLAEQWVLSTIRLASS